MEGLYLDLKWISMQFHVYSIVLGIGSLNQTYCNFENIESILNGIFNSLLSEIRSSAFLFILQLYWLTQHGYLSSNPVD